MGSVEPERDGGTGVRRLLLIRSGRGCSDRRCGEGESGYLGVGGTTTVLMGWTLIPAG
jgi:hypothetical protein